MSQPGSVSVVITAYNRADLLPVTIESVLNQTRPPREVILVDDGSTDSTPEVAARFPTVHYVRQENQGVGAARNRGLSLASGDYVNFLDDDDWFLPPKLERQGAILDTKPEVGLVYCRLERGATPGELTGSCLDGHRPPSDPVRAILEENFILLHAPLVRRELLDRIRGFSTERAIESCADYDCWLRLLVSGARIEFCDEILAGLRVTAESMSSDRRRHLGMLLQARLTGTRPAVSGGSPAQPTSLAENC
jgi:glycosyltransferase involved in cell wall biosynthesis